QLDRFMFNVKVDYPVLEDERMIVMMSARDDRPEMAKVLTGERIVAWQKLVRKVEVPGFVIDFIVKLVRATRPKDPTAPDLVKRLVDWGAGPRAGQFLVRAGQAFAAMDGRPSVAIDDVRKAAIPVLRHRVSANFQAQAEGKNSDDIVMELLKIVSEPEPAKYVSRKKS
ncbi:MAG TPA: MoxR family ATPase, partial [Gemmataceae bacterium]|nr:MoxR family ATPase [Gemmataceae bacterium]